MQPRFEGIDSVYKSKADNKDIRDLLVKLVPKAKAQMVEFSKGFKGRTNKETCKKIFDYIKSNFTYVAERGAANGADERSGFKWRRRNVQEEEKEEAQEEKSSDCAEYCVR